MRPHSREANGPSNWPRTGRVRKMANRRNSMRHRIRQYPEIYLVFKDSGWISWQGVYIHEQTAGREIFDKEPSALGSFLACGWDKGTNTPVWVKNMPGDWMVPSGLVLWYSIEYTRLRKCLEYVIVYRRDNKRITVYTAPPGGWRPFLEHYRVEGKRTRGID